MATRIGQVGRGWACIGIQFNYSKTRPWLSRIGQVGGRVGPGRVGPSRGRVGLSGVGEGLGMHWASIKLL